MRRNPHELDSTLQKIVKHQTGEYLREMWRVQEQIDDEEQNRNRRGGHSLVRLLDGLAAANVSNIAPGEWEESERIAQILGRPPRPGYAFIPVKARTLEQRDLNVAVASAGGYLVETSNPGDIFIDALRNSSIIERFGVSRFNATSNAFVPKATGSVTTQWLPTESTSITESQHVFAGGAALPKHVAGYCEVDGNLLKQVTPAGQNFVLREMARAVAEERDSAFINGSGANGEPLGILNTPDIGSESGTALAWAGILQMVHDVESTKGLVTPQAGGWAVNPAAAKILRGRERATGSGFIMDNGKISDYRALSTGSMPAGTALFGDWSRVWILEWGVLEVGADPYGVNSALFTKNLVGLRAIWSCDVLVLSPESFSVATSIT